MNWDEQVAAFEAAPKHFRIELIRRLENPPKVHARLLYRNGEEWLLGGVFHLPVIQWAILAMLFAYFHIEVSDAVPVDQPEVKGV